MFNQRTQSRRKSPINYQQCVEPKPGQPPEKDPGKNPDRGPGKPDQNPERKTQH